MIDNTIKPRLICEKDAARYLGVSRSYLANSRCAGNDNAPPYVKYGRMIRYDLKYLDAWIESRKHKPTGAIVSD